MSIQKIKIKDLNELCDKNQSESVSTNSSFMLKSKKRVRRRIASSSDSEIAVVENEIAELDIISIKSSEPATPKKKLCIEEGPKKKTNSSRKKNKKILDGSNCKKITDFFNSAKKTPISNKSLETLPKTQPVKKSTVRRNLKVSLTQEAQPIIRRRPVTRSKIKEIQSTEIQTNLDVNLTMDTLPVNHETQLIIRPVKKSKNLNRIFRSIENVPNGNIPVIRSSKKKEPPKYKIIEGTSFAVDAFNFGEIDGVTDYFLTHFHADHYIGLKKSFQFPIYMTQITANLVNAFIKVDPKFFRILNFNESYEIGNSTVVAIDANQ